VDLGAWNLSDFTAIGHTTDAQPFSITLNSCVTDARLPAQTVTYAHIRLDPTAGSTLYDASAGQFTLGTGSTAKGVVLQILHDDETAITLANVAGALTKGSPGSLRAPELLRNPNRKTATTAQRKKFLKHETVDAT
jgi:type 1 fimbria pilin